MQNHDSIAIGLGIQSAKAGSGLAFENTAAKSARFRSHRNYRLFPMAFRRHGAGTPPRHGVADYGGKGGLQAAFESTACRTIAIGLALRAAKREDIPVLIKSRAGRSPPNDASERHLKLSDAATRLGTSGSSMRQFSSARVERRLYYECIIAKENAATRQGDSVVSSARVHQQCYV
jgi:hypothetical protein